MYQEQRSTYLFKLPLKSFQKKCHPVTNKMSQVKVELKYTLANTASLGKYHGRAGSLGAAGLPAFILLVLVSMSK